MTLQETVLLVFYAAEPLLPFMAVAGILTGLALVALLILSHGIWVDRPGFRWLGLFYGLSGMDCVRLSCAWLKLCLLLSYLVAFQKLQATHYILAAVPCLLFSLSVREIRSIPTHLLGCLMELVGLFAVNVVCGYIWDMHPGVGFLLVYILLCLFLALYAVYLFLTELNAVSNGRRVWIGE